MTAIEAFPTVHSVSQLKLIELPCYVRDDGKLIALETDKQAPFAIARVFSVKAALGARRGMHAHKRCAQFMLCPHGAIDIICDDGTERKLFALDRFHIGLFVPPSIWAEEVSRVEGSVLVVLCDRLYEEDDYIRDYGTFISLRGVADHEVR